MTDRSIVVRIRAEIGNFRSDMRTAAAASTELGTATTTAGRSVVGAMTQAQASAATTRQALFDTGKAAQVFAQGFGLSYNAVGQLTDEFGNMVTAAHAAELGLDTASEATREYAAQTARGAAETAAAAQAAATASQTSLSRLTASARENEQAWTVAGGAMLAFGTAAVAGFALSIAKYAEFDKAMSEVKASTHETSANMGLLREAAIEAGADTSFSAKEAAQGIDELAKAGVSTTDVLAGGLTGSLSLAAAGSLDVGEAAEIAATALTQFKLSGKDIPHIADLLAAGAGKAQGSVQDIGAALGQSGLVASQFGLSVDDTVGSLAAFASAGLVGSDAGTSLKTMLLKLAAPAEATQKVMDEMGIAAYDASGAFVGVTGLAEQLKTKLGGLTQAQRDSTLAMIFGTDAIRGANVLYEQGADGMQGWIDKVNDVGYAAVTASIKQDNLAGDIEKLGGSFDTVLIRGGEGAAQSLRTIVQGAEDLVDMLGKVDPELLQLGAGLIGAVGGTALLAGGFVTMLPRVLETRSAFRTLQSTNGPLASGLGKVGKAAGVAAAGLLAISAVGAIFGDKEITSATDYANAILRVGDAGNKASSSGLDAVFSKWDEFGGSETVNGINTASDAIGRLTNHNWEANVNQFFDGFTGFLNLPKSELGQIEERLKGLGDELGNLASNGGAEVAAQSFNALTDEFEKNGQGAQEALDKMPGYRDALLQLGKAAGVSLEPQQLLELATGKVPQVMLNAQEATEREAEATKAAAEQTEVLSTELDEMGVSVSGTVSNLDAFTQALVAAGLLTLSSRDAARGYLDTLDTFNETLAKNGQNLDITTKAGRENEAALDAIAKSGIAAAEAIAADTLAYETNDAAQAAVQESLKVTYQDLVNGYTAMGKSTEEAEALTRGMLHIPTGVSIETWLSDAAKLAAGDTKAAIDAIPGSKTVTIYGNIDPSFAAAAAQAYALGDVKHAPGALVNADDSGIGGGFTGGLVGELLAGRAGGGLVPGRIPLNSHGDNILASVNGKPFGLRSGEMVINEPQTSKHMPLLQSINAGTYEPPSKSLAGGYAASMSQSFSGSGSGGGGGMTVDLSGANFTSMDPAQLKREVVDEITYKLGQQGVRLGN